MFVQFVRRKSARFGALFALILGLALIGGSATFTAARADSPGYQSDVQDQTVPGSSIAVGLAGDPGVVKGTGKILGPGGPRTFDLGNAGDHESWTGLDAGMYFVSTDTPPAPGLWTAGFYIFESPDTTPQCPNNPSLYAGGWTFTLDAQHPHWVACIRLIQVTTIANSSVTFGIRNTTPDGDNSWQGRLTGPQNSSWLWSTLGIGGPNYLGYMMDVAEGDYSVQPGNPVRPGWQVAGYASYETDSHLDACPFDNTAYLPYPTPVHVSAAHPKWGICVLVEPAPVTPDPEPSPTPAPPIDLGPIDWPGITPEPTATPSPVTPTATPTAPKPTSTPTTPKQTSTATPPQATSTPRPGGTSQPAGDAPLPPNTGTGANHGGTSPAPLALGVLLVAVAGLIVAADRLPGRPKR